MKRTYAPPSERLLRDFDIIIGLIERALHISKEQVLSKSRQNNILLTRIVVTHYLDSRGYRVRDICKVLPLMHSTIIYYKHRYENINYDPALKAAVNAIERYQHQTK